MSNVKTQISNLKSQKLFRAGLSCERSVNDKRMTNKEYFIQKLRYIGNKSAIIENQVDLINLLKMLKSNQSLLPMYPVTDVFWQDTLLTILN